MVVVSDASRMPRTNVIHSRFAAPDKPVQLLSLPWIFPERLRTSQGDGATGLAGRGTHTNYHITACTIFQRRRSCGRFILGEAGLVADHVLRSMVTTTSLSVLEIVTRYHLTVVRTAPLTSSKTCTLPPADFLLTLRRILGESVLFGRPPW